MTILLRTCLLAGKTALQSAQKAWWWLRQFSGDAAYEHYVHHATSARFGEAPGTGGTQGVLSRKEFFLDALRRRYSSVSRCC